MGGITNQTARRSARIGRWMNIGFRRFAKDTGHRRQRPNSKDQQRSEMMALCKSDLAQACSDRERALQEIGEVRLRRRIRTLLIS